jgi:hypothetical protein
MNQLFTLIRAFPDKQWDWSVISRRNDISFEYVFAHLDDHPWDWTMLSLNPQVGSWTNVQAHPELPWSYLHLACNPTVPLDIVLADPGRFHMIQYTTTLSCDNEYTLYNRSDFAPQIAFEHPHFKWYWRGITSNPKITYELIKANPHIEWCWHAICLNKRISLDDLLSEPAITRINDIIASPHITPEMVPIIQAMPKFNQSSTLADAYYVYSLNKSLPIEYVIANPQLPWNWDCISCHPDLTVDVIDTINTSRAHIPWSAVNLSFKNRSLTVDFVRRHIDWEWNWNYLSMNPSFTLDNIKNNPDIPWTTAFVSNPNSNPSDIIRTHGVDLAINAPFNINPNLTIKHVLDNPELPWNWRSLCTFKFHAQPRLTIQRWWKAYFKRNRKAQLEAAEQVMIKFIKCPYVSKYILDMIYKQ